MNDFFADYVSHALFKISLQVPQILNMVFILKPLKWGHHYIKDT